MYVVGIVYLTLLQGPHSKNKTELFINDYQKSPLLPMKTKKQPLAQFKRQQICYGVEIYLNNKQHKQYFCHSLANIKQCKSVACIQQPQKSQEMTILHEKDETQELKSKTFRQISLKTVSFALTELPVYCTCQIPSSSKFTWYKSTF